MLLTFIYVDIDKQDEVYSDDEDDMKEEIAKEVNSSDEAILQNLSADQAISQNAFINAIPKEGDSISENNKMKIDFD